LYQLPEKELRSAIGRYTAAATPRRSWRLLWEQWRRPVRRYCLGEKVLMWWEAVVLWQAAFYLRYRRSIPERVLARGKRREDIGPRA